MNSQSKICMLFSTIILTLSIPNGLHAQMTGEKVLDDYLNAIGGSAAFEKIQNSITISTFEVDGHNIKFKSTMYQKKPNLYYSVSETKAGKVEQGFNGEVAWENSSINGPRIKEGDEFWIVFNYMRLDFVNKWKDIFKEIKFEGEENFEGQPCYVIAFIPQNGPSCTAYFSQKTKLCIRNMYTYNTTLGRINVDIHILKYKKYNDISMEAKSKIIMAGVVLTKTVNNIKFNANLPTDCFKLPVSISNLLEIK